MGLLTKSTVLARPFKSQLLSCVKFAGLASQAAPVRKPIDNRNVLVTGSARGIGKAIALRLASDGYNVCINDIDANSKACNAVVKEIQAMGRKACIAVADVSKRREVKDMIQTSVKELGPLHTMSASSSHWSRK